MRGDSHKDSDGNPKGFQNPERGPERPEASSPNLVPSMDWAGIPKGFGRNSNQNQESYENRLRGNSMGILRNSNQNEEPYEKGNSGIGIQRSGEIGRQPK